MKFKLTIVGALAALLLAAPAGLRAAPAGGEDADGEAKKILVKKKVKPLKKKVKPLKKKVIVRHHPHRVPRYVPVRRRARVVRRKVVVHRPVVVPVKETVVVHHRRPRRTVVRDEWDSGRLGVALRAVAGTVQGEMLNLAAVENPTMGGLGLQFRGKVSSHWGLELGLDWMMGDSGRVVQTTVPLMLSAYYQFFPRSRFQPHVLAGVGTHFTKLEYDSGFRYDTVQLAGQVGGGLEVRLTDWLALTADVRVLGLFKNLGTQSSIERECIQSTGDVAHCNGLSTLDTADQWNLGAQFMAGAAIYF